MTNVRPVSWRKEARVLNALTRPEMDGRMKHRKVVLKLRQKTGRPIINS